MRSGPYPRIVPLVLLLLLASCDVVGLDSIGGERIRVTVEDANGDPVDGWQVYLCYGCPEHLADATAPTVEKAGGPGYVVSLAYPNPFQGLTTLTIEQIETGLVKVEVRTLEDEPVEVVYDGVMESGGVHSTRWEPSETVPLGVYALHVSGEHIAEEVQYVSYSGHRFELYYDFGTLYDLGVTDDRGRVSRDDPEVLPFGYELEAAAVDAQGNRLGELDFGPDAQIVVLEGTDGPVVGRFDRRLDDGNNDLTITLSELHDEGTAQAGLPPRRAFREDPRVTPPSPRR